MIKFIYIILVFTFITTTIKAQEMYISKDLSIKNTSFYDLLGKVNNRILLIRNSPNELLLDVFDDDLTHIRSQELLTRYKRKNILGVSSTSTYFTIIFSKDKKTKDIYVYKYNHLGERIDSTMFVSKFNNINNVRFQNSINDSVSVLFNLRNNGLSQFYVINNVSLDLLWEDEFQLNTNIKNNFQSLVVNNKGIVIILDKQEQIIFSKHREEYNLIVIDSSYYSESLVTIDESYFIGSFNIEFNNIDNNSIDLFGFFGDNDYSTIGYFNHRSNLFSLSDSIQLVPLFFESSIIRKYNNKYNLRFNYIENLYLKDVIHKVDKGFVLIGEINRKFQRSNVNRFQRTSSQIWTDYLDRDIFVLNYSKTDSLVWQKILHKNQFSHDNYIIFSSFFIQLNEENICFLFNDEIKSNSTVTKYCISPLGYLDRKTIINTNNKELQLRFNDAVQLSYNEFLVPNQNGNYLNIVKLKLKQR